MLTHNLFCIFFFSNWMLSIIGIAISFYDECNDTNGGVNDLHGYR